MWRSSWRRLPKISKRLVQLRYSSFAGTQKRSFTFFELKDALDELEVNGSSDADYYGSLLQACTRFRKLEAGRRVHRHIVKAGLEDRLFLKNYLIHMYGKCGDLSEAERLFEATPVKNVVSWTSLISGYIDHGYNVQALDCFEKMQIEKVEPSRVTFITVLGACDAPAFLDVGRRIYDQVSKMRMEMDSVLETALMGMYVKCGSLWEARKILDRSLIKDQVTWNVMISVLATHSQEAEAFLTFRKMQLEGVFPNTITYVSVLNACTGPAALDEGRLIHRYITQSPIKVDVFLETALVNMYGKCDSVESARAMFDQMKHQNVVSWNMMITLYVDNGRMNEALHLFWLMQLENVPPDKITFTRALNSCENVDHGQRIEVIAVESGWINHLAVQNVLLSMYGRCGNLEQIRCMFDGMNVRDVVSWTAVIAAYYQRGQNNEALTLYNEMQEQRVGVDAILLTTVLHACANLAALSKGRELIAVAAEHGFQNSSNFQAAMVNMYSKCGCHEDARAVFKQMKSPGVIPWNCLIGAQAQHGNEEEVFKFFEMMQQEGVKCDDVTFVIVLSACSHSGSVKGACYIIGLMIMDFERVPSKEHYCCVIDVLGRTGRLKDAEILIKRLDPDPVLWTTLLGACRFHKDVKRAQDAAENVLRLDPGHAPSYIVLSNIFAQVGDRIAAENIRRIMVRRGVKKEPGYSCIEVGKRIHRFFVHDKSHPESDRIYAALDRLNVAMKDEGYVPETSLVLHDVEEEQKASCLKYHSEKLAIAYGLVSTPPGECIRIVKNLRVCSDCHTASKFITRITGREIMMRDAYRFHRVKDGKCSCGDFW